MSGPKYLTTPIAEAKHDDSARPRLTRDGYTVRAGSPTGTLIRLQGETRWRRVMVWCFSNSGTRFVRVKGECLIVRDVPGD